MTPIGGPDGLEGGGDLRQDRGDVGSRRLAEMLAAGAHCAVRLQQGIQWTILARREVPAGLQPGGVRLRSDWTVRPTSGPDVLLRIVSYQLPPISSPMAKWCGG
jgi:hypothetical protein